LALALLGVWQFSLTSGQVNSLVTASDHTQAVLQEDRLLETMRRAALRYQTKGDQAVLKEFTDTHARATEMLMQSIKEATSDERRRGYQ
jgi:hypothetical protein